MDLASAALDLLYPRVCMHCGARVGAGGVYICWDCATRFPLIRDPFCSLCGDPVDGRIENVYQCSFCRRHPPGFDRARSALRFRGLLRDTLHAFKYLHAAHLRKDLVRWLSACHQTHYAHLEFEAIVCVPLHARRERERTYNQSALLARELGRELNVPVWPRAMARTRATPSQINLTARQRRQNVRGAFGVPQADWIDGRRLLLVDDIMTTGATVSECSRVLKEAGAVSVHVLTVARG